MCFAKLETEVRKIILSRQFDEISCLNERIFSSYTLFIGVFLFQHKLHQSTNMYSDDENDGRVSSHASRDRNE